MQNYKYTIAYIATMVLVNVGFEYIPLIKMTWLGSEEKYPPMALIVGIVFILRDYTQREIGHKVLGAMAIGGVLSYVMASPFVALASVVAFVISELVDWGYYTCSKKSLRERILISSLLSTPVDSAIFLIIINHFTIIGTMAMFLSKMIAALAIWYWLGKRDAKTI